MALLIERSTIRPSSIFCVGKNYRDHALEMEQWEQKGLDPKHALLPEEPVIFMKPASALSPEGTTSIPVFGDSPLSACMHYEVELVLLIDRDVDFAPPEEASGYIRGYGVGLDMTLRDVQLEAKKTGNPWLKSKGFRQSALVSDFISRTDAGRWQELSIALRHNGTEVQHSAVSEMIFSPEYLVHYLSWVYGLRKDDLVFTGTPAGVGRVSSGDRLDAYLSGKDRIMPEQSALVSLEVYVS
jgi:2-keto-4-pentenoate hydratase/2-oxohepta-3-ene-1,7-dioic acid hydratase in catechol pathway